MAFARRSTGVTADSKRQVPIGPKIGLLDMAPLQRCVSLQGQQDPCARPTYMLKIFLLVTLALVAPAAAQSRSAAAPKQGKKPSAPMIFYLAKGGPDACGAGCSEWIAAEGRIDESSAQRLRALLTQIGKRKLPIFFHSAGGVASTAREMGHLLRERAMSAGVYQTVPTGCAGATEQACRVLKQSGQALPAALRTIASCDSACVFALIGAKMRQVPPGARIGIHSVKLVIEWGHARDAGFSDRQIASYEKTRLAEINAQHRRYAREMGVDVGLIDLSLQVPHTSIHYLSREEIVRFGIDPQEFQETRWDALDLGSPELWALKFFIEGAAKDRKELHAGFLRISCRNSRQVGITYFRHTGFSGAGGEATIRFAAGERSVALSRFGSVVTTNAIESGASYNTWGAVSSFEFLEAVAARTNMELVGSGDAEVPARITKLSTAGLSQAISALQLRCGPKPE